MAITSRKPFVCSALGSVYEYRADFADQLVLQMFAASGDEAVIACRPYEKTIDYEFTGTERPWNHVRHSPNQVDLVYRELLAQS